MTDQRDDGPAVEVADEVVDAAPKGSAVALLNPIRLIEATLDDLKADAKKADWDVETTDGDKAARAFRARCVRIRTSADAAYEQGNKPLLEAQRDARQLVAAIKAAVGPIEKVWDDKIKAKEERKEREKLEREAVARARLTAIRRSIEEITTAPVAAAACSSSIEIAAMLDRITAIVCDESVFGEFVEEAEGARLRVMSTLSTLHTAAVGREEEAASLELKRQELARQQAEFERLRREQEERELAAKRKAQRVADLRESIDSIRSYVQRAISCNSAAELGELLEELDGMDVDAIHFEELLDDAERAHAETRDRVARLLEAMLAQERANLQRANAERAQADAAAELKRQQDAFEEERQQAEAQLKAQREQLERERQAELDRIEEANRALQEQPEPAAPSLSSLLSIVAPAPVAAALGAASTRPTDTEIVEVLSLAFGAPEYEVLSWIVSFNMAEQSARILEAA